MQRLLADGALRAKLEVGSPHDPLEHEADVMADAALRHVEPPCRCGGTCPRCRARAKRRIQRQLEGGTRAPALAPPAGAEGLLTRLGSGTPLPASSRAFFEERFGRDLGGVRLHQGRRADEAARALGARAFTAGREIVFRDGELAPDSAGGRRLLAHELAHVVQQQDGAAARLRRTPDARSMTITAAWAESLSNDELDRQIALVTEQIQAAGLPPGNAQRETAQSNLWLLQNEVYRRSLGGASAPGFERGVTRPPGLPVDQGYSLVEVPDLPPEVVAAMPEGQLVDELPTGTAPGGSLAPTDTTTSASHPFLASSQIVGGTSFGTLTTSARALNTWGFAAGGQNAIGLVAFPQVGSPGHGFPQSRLAWGHTALYTRVDGQIRIIRSHGPSSLLEVLSTERSTGGGVKAGRIGVPGSIYDASYTPGRGIPMFTHTGARSIEYPVSPEAARRFAAGLPEVGEHPLKYTGVPATNNLCNGVNCTHWATRTAEQGLRGQFGPLDPVTGRPTSIADLGSKGAPGGSVNQASQGRMYGWMGEAGRPGQQVMGVDSRTGARVLATIGQDGKLVVNALPEAATGAPVVGQMSRGMRYLRWGGRVFFVFGIVTGGAEIALADPGQRLRTTAEVAGGFGGGFLGSAAGGAAAGAAAGLVCGPGAPVCSTVLAIGGALIGGFLGGMAGRSLIGRLFDALGYDQAAYRASVDQFMTTLEHKTQGYFVIGADGQSRWVPPDPRYAAYAGAIQRFKTGESGGCQTCHDINFAWGQTARTWGSAMPEGDAFAPPYGTGALLQAEPKSPGLSDQELQTLRQWLEATP